MRSVARADSTAAAETTPPRLLLDVEAVAKMLSISTRSVLRRVKEEELPEPIYIGRLARWRPSDIEACINRKFDEANLVAQTVRRNRRARLHLEK